MRRVEAVVAHGSVYKPRLYGSYSPEEVLGVLEDWIDWHAYRLASQAPGQVDNLYYQDLAQEGRLAVYRLVEREPHIWAPKLLRLAILAMYAARRRGRSVFRADPYHRLRTYEQVSWELMAAGMEDGGGPCEVTEEDGWRIVGIANDGVWEEGMAGAVVPLGVVMMSLREMNHGDAWEREVLYRWKGSVNACFYKA